jgi:hypothetical protein
MSNPHAANRVFLDEEGVIHNVYVGDQTYGDVKAVEEETLRIAARVEEGQRPIRVMADLSGMGRTSAGSRRAAKEALQKLPHGRVAIYGGNVFMKHLANFIIVASGKGETTRVLDTEGEAIRWLLAPPRRP